MAIDITALYCCLDDFCKVFEDWEAHRLIPWQTTRQRTGKLYADKGYIGQDLFKTFWQRGLHLITGTARTCRIA